MGADTNIEWCHHSCNLWWGCVKVSPLCDHCYAERDSIRYGHYIFGLNARRRFIKSVLTDVPKWDEEARKAGEVRRVFWMSMGDLFEQLPENHPDRADMAHKRMHGFFLMERTRNLHHLLLTKRISNVRDMVPEGWLENWPAHIRIGVSVGTQKDADRDIPRLLQLPCPNFVSMEPLLESVDLTQIRLSDSGDVWLNALTGQSYTAHEIGGVMRGSKKWRTLNWVITGGESGPKARPSHPDWFRQLRDQCVEAGVPFFFKQWGEWRPSEGDETKFPEGWPDTHFKAPLHCFPEDGELDTCVSRVGKKRAGRVLDGREWNEFPEVAL